MPYQRQPEIPGFLNRHGGVATGYLIPDSVSKDKAKAAYTRACHRCGGQGGSEAWRHTGYTCYQCGGSGTGLTVDIVIYTPEGYEKMNSAREKRKAKRDLKLAEERRRIAEEDQRLHDSRLAEFTACYPGLVDRLALHANDKEDPEYYGDDAEPTFLAEMHLRITKKGELTEKQAKAVIKVFNAIDAKEIKINSSRYLADIGEKLTLTVKNVFTKDLTDRDLFPIIYKYLVIMESECGQQVKYIGNSNSVPYQKGNTKVISCKVKKHEEYNGIKQTCIERPREVKSAKSGEV